MLLDYGTLKRSVPSDLLLRYQVLANSTMLFLCAGCHVSKTLALNSSSELITEAREGLLQRFRTEEKPQEKQDEFFVSMRSYGSGVMTTSEFFDHCKTCFSSLHIGTSKEASETMHLLLPLIENPERRNTLHLRFLNERPKFQTTCCSKVHCFFCKTKDFHEGKSCEENIALFDTSVLPCPSCGVTLTKADGCNTVSCVCGHQFAWAPELEVSHSPIQHVMYGILAHDTP